MSGGPENSTELENGDQKLPSGSEAHITTSISPSETEVLPAVDEHPGYIGHWQRLYRPLCHTIIWLLATAYNLDLAEITVGGGSVD